MATALVDTGTDVNLIGVNMVPSNKTIKKSSL